MSVMLTYLASIDTRGKLNCANSLASLRERQVPYDLRCLAFFVSASGPKFERFQRVYPARNAPRRKCIG